MSKSSEAKKKEAMANTFANRDAVKAIVDRIEAANRDLVRERMDYMERCKRHHETKKAAYDDAKNTLGIPKQSLRAVIKARALERKAKAARDDLIGDVDLLDKFDRIRSALGDFADLPLGQAAVAAAMNGADVTEGAPV